MPPISFSENEAIAIFFACQALQYFGSLPFDESAAAAVHKFYHYLPEDVKEQIEQLRNKVVIWNPYRSMDSACLQTPLQAIMRKSVVTITYKSDEGQTVRDIQPIGLYSSEGYWYCPAFCHLRRTYRLFRADRILSSHLNEEVAYREEYNRSVFEWITPDLAYSEQITLVAKLTPVGVRQLESNVWFGSHIELHEDGGGTLRKRIPVKKLTFFTDMIWALGEAATITEPLEAVHYIRQKVERVRLQYL
ncbi:WYL domain-containing protein [Paenibacillus sp. P25]|nr:WYL domain-containing protein [Paenibacillus sp. P25]